MSARPFTPRPYQGLIIDHELELGRCCVFAGMGTGKTVSTLSALDIMYISGESAPTLVLGPLRVANQVWGDEARKWNHLRHIEVHPMIGSPAQRRLALHKALGAGNASVFTLNYENLPWLAGALEALGRPWPFATVVSDESTRLKSFRGSVQTSIKGKEFIRGGGGIRARALKDVAHGPVKRWINLTGTPSPNGIADLWGQMWFVDRGRRLGGTFEAFKQRWFHKSYDGYGIVALPHAQGEIMARISDVCLSINAKDWFDLREPIVHTVHVDLPPRARELYRQMEKQMFMEIESHQVEAFNAAARTIKTLQLANGACYIDDNAETWREVHDAKIQALESIISEAGGMPVLVAYHFRSDLERLLKAFPRGRHLDKKPKTIDDWNAGKIPVLFAHPASAGHGLSLQDGGNILVFFSHWWDLELYQQIIERIGPTRQAQAGHERNVFIYHIVARDTVDEVVMERRDNKREVQDLLMEYMKRGAKR